MVPPSCPDPQLSFPGSAIPPGLTLLSFPPSLISPFLAPKVGVVGLLLPGLSPSSALYLSVFGHASYSPILSLSFPVGIPPSLPPLFYHSSFPSPHVSPFALRLFLSPSSLFFCWWLYFWGKGGGCSLLLAVGKNVASLWRLLISPRAGERRKARWAGRGEVSFFIG